MNPKKRPRKGLGRKLLLLFVSLLFAALLVEGAVRVRQWMKYGSAGGELYASSRDETLGILRLDPDQKTDRLTINERGFRGPPVELPKPTGRRRIAFLGGSTTFCAEVKDSEAWPARVAESLRALGGDWDFVNGGIPGYGIEESQKNLENFVKPLDPDVIVIYHATNDLSRDTRKLAQEKGLWDGDVDPRSFMAKISVAWDLVEKNVRVKSRLQRAKDGVDRLEYDAPALAAGFEARLLELVRAAQKEAKVVAVATFSPRVRASQSSDAQLEACNTSLYYMPYMSVKGLLAGFDAYNEAIRRVAATTGAVLVDGEDRIPGDGEHYNDSVHFKAAGCAAMAKRVMLALSKSEDLATLVKTNGGR